MVEFIHHYTTESPDSEGRYLVGSNQVIDVFYYDIGNETWKRDFSNVANPFSNPNFLETTITGVAGGGPVGHYWYETGTDATAADKYFKFNKLPFDHANNVIARIGSLLTSTPSLSSTVPYPIPKDYLARSYVGGSLEQLTNTFPSSYDSNARLDLFWLTSSGVGGPSGAGGDGMVTWTLSSQTDVAGFWIDSYDCEIVTELVAQQRAIGKYTIEVATSGNGTTTSTYTPVASGTRSLKDTHPIWVQIPPTPAKYIRIRFRNNGHATQSCLGKFYAYTQDVIDKGMSMYVMSVNDSNVVPANGTGSSYREFFLNQRVDLSGIDRIYFDIRDRNVANSDRADILINGVQVNTFNLGSPVAANNIVVNEIPGYSVDTTAYGADSIFTLKKRISHLGALDVAMTQISNFSAVPGWYSEAPSSKRGSKAAFPKRTIIVCDAAGLSIVDDDDLTLWMRFDVGYKKMLQMRPLKARAVNGSVYVATTCGLFIINFLKNRCQRIDGRGPRVRYGIEHRNVNDFNTDEWLNTTDSTVPDWMRYTYMYETGVPTFPSYCIYDIAVGIDPTFGLYVLLATHRGLVLFNGSTGGSGLVYSSLNDLPVTDVKVANGSIWYLQGEGYEQVLNYIPSISSAAVANFVPTKSFFKEVHRTYDLVEKLDPNIWEVVEEDPGMSVIGGDVLTISGTHTASGATGIILRGTLPDRSFTAKVEVKIKDFPPDARGALRFGICKDYHPIGPMSLDSNLGKTNRSGFFISAFNADPYPWPLLESTPFDSNYLSDDRGWFYSAQMPDKGTSSADTTKLAKTTASGIFFKCYNGRGNFAADFAEDINRFSSIPMQARDFKAKMKVQLVNAFSASTNSNSALNPTAFFGWTRHDEFAPGTGVATGNYVDGAMMVGGSTTFSGVLVYTTGTYASTNFPVPSLTQPKIPVLAPESTGTATSPFREWQVNYDSGSNGISCFLDGAAVGSMTSTSYVNPHRLGLTFGVGAHGGQTNIFVYRYAVFGSLTMEYPTLVSGSRYKYGMEVSSTLTGDLSQIPAYYPTYSGISKTNDTTPVSGTLTTFLGLGDGNTSTGAITVAQNLSIGIALDQPRTVEALYLYDQTSSTSGWSSTATKRVDVRHSNNNKDWTFYKRYDLNAGYRVSGLTKIRFAPAIEAKFIKITPVDPSYLVGGGGAWVVSEIKAATVSGIDFFPEDNTEDAEFHEWKLTYDKNSGAVTSYIDGNVITTATFAGSLKESHLMLLHDLSPSSGTHTDFHGEFRNLEITFPGSAISSGEITALAITHNPLPGGNPNYSVMSGSTESLVISDFDFGANPAPDLVRVFGHEAIFGDSEFIPVIVPEAEAHRSDGLVFVGTSVFIPARYKNRIKRPAWFERWSTATYYQYGRNYSWCYHPVSDKIFILQDNSSTYFLITDINRGRSKQVSRMGYKEISGGSYESPINPDIVKMVYATYDNRIWMYSAANVVTRVEADTGEATKITFSDTRDGAGVTGGRYYITYALHNHKIVCGTNFLQVIDVPTRTADKNPLYFPNDNENFGRVEPTGDAGKVPWAPDSTGVSEDVQDYGTGLACYSEYDKTIYMLGIPNANFHNPVYLCKFNIEKNHIQVVGTGSEDRTWPVSDSTLYNGVPVPIVLEKTTNMVYDSKRRRIYILTLLGAKSLLFYYDVVAQKWVDTGLSPPFIDMADWPTSSTTINTNMLIYDSHSDRLLLATGAGGTEGSYIYELHDDRDAIDPGFDYQPLRDGLPGQTPTTNHFTTMSGIMLPDTMYSSTAWNRDFYYTSSTSNTTQYFKYTYGPDYLTISGANPGSYDDFGSDVYELYISSQSTTPVRSFELSAKVSLPLFSRVVYNDNAYLDSAAHFILGIADGVNRPWARQNWVGTADPNIMQSLELRMGVEGASHSTATRALRAHLNYVDSFNTDDLPYVLVPLTRPQPQYNNYTTGLDLGSQFSTFKDVKLVYDYETDTATGYIDGVVCGTTKLRRKFSSNGVRFHIGFLCNSDDDTANNQRWMARVKDIRWACKATDKVEDGRLVTSISGSVGTYMHQRYDATLSSGIDWVYETDIYYPTSKRFSGFDYIATIGGISDGHKLAELVTFMSGTVKKIGVVGNIDTRHDSKTYLGVASYLWDDRDIGLYRIVRDTYDDTVRVFAGASETPVIEVPYDSLPASKDQRVYYGKINYGVWEKVFESRTEVGTWTTNPNTTNDTFPEPDLYLRAFNKNAKFATITQGTGARATFAITPGLGDVDLYCFYVATATDGVINAPYTIVSEGLLLLPTAVGTGQCVASILTDTDEFGNADLTKTTLKVDQRRIIGGVLTSTSRVKSQGSGWIYLGKYRNPTSVIQTASASVGSSSTQGFVCADAIGIDIGKYGKSTFEMQVRRVRYRTNATDFVAPYEDAGLTVLDLESNRTIDSYGELTAPAFLDSNITSGVERK